MTSKIARGAGLLSAGVLVELLVGFLALGLSATQASAQPLPPYYPGVAVYPGYMPGLPPHQVVAVVRSTGLEPLSGPMRHGPTYSVRAVDPAGREYRVIVDARIGRVLRAVPLPGPYYAVPVVPPYGRPIGPSAMAPDGYGPSSRIAALPPGAGGPPTNGPAIAGVPGGSAPGANTAPHPKVQAGPPLPRPRPRLAATDSSAPTGAPPQAAQAPAASSSGTIKETNDATGAVPPPAPAPAATPPAPAVTPPTPPPPMSDELHE